jgi:raffinose/stachyose/melibiose transport system substrate-binding protein
MEGGDQNLIYNAIKGDIKFSENVVLKKAAEDLKKLIEVNGKEEMISQEDFNASMNLFTQEKAAMYYMGSWEVGMENNPTLSDRFKQNIRVTNLPLSKGGGLVAWNGGGYAVSSKSEVKEEAIKLLEYMMKPENWSKMGWENGLIVPAQKNEDNRYKNESVLQKEIVNILNNAESQSGTPWYDSLTPNFKASIEDLSYQLALGGKNIEDFLLEVDKEIAKEKSE